MVTPLKYIILFCPSYCNGCGIKKDYFYDGVAYKYLKISCTGWSAPKIQKDCFLNANDQFSQFLLKTPKPS